MAALFKKKNKGGSKMPQEDDIMPGMRNEGPGMEESKRPCLVFGFNLLIRVFTQGRMGEESKCILARCITRDWYGSFPKLQNRMTIAILRMLDQPSKTVERYNPWTNQTTRTQEFNLKGTFSIEDNDDLKDVMAVRQEISGSESLNDPHLEKFTTEGMLIINWSTVGKAREIGARGINVSEAERECLMRTDQVMRKREW